MAYAKIVSGAVAKYPYRETDLRTDNPQVSFPSNALANATMRADYGIEEVATVAQPVKPGWIITEGTPTKMGSTWTQTWTTVAKNAADVQIGEIEAVTPPVKDGFTADEGLPELKADDKWYQTWTLIENPYLISRNEAYGRPEEQLEYIVENGLAAFITRQEAIKAQYPKS